MGRYDNLPFLNTPINNYKYPVRKVNLMNFNPPAKVRAAIYIIVTIGTAILVPLHAAHIVSDVIMSVWSSVAGAATLLAAVNVTTNSQDQK